MATTVIAAFLVVLSVAAAAAAEDGGCTEELISFSECLSYVSYPPNNLTESASEKCCNAFSSAADSLCMCYLLRDPLILGFPLNTTRLLSLSSLCTSPFPISTSFTFLCSASTVLPPLNNAPTPTLGTTAARSGSGSRSGSRSRGKKGPSGEMVPRAGTDEDEGTPLYFPTFNASKFLTPHNTLLLSQILAIILTLLST